MKRTDHDNEEEIYFPFLIANGAKLPEEKGMVMSHKELVEALKQMKMIFETVLDKEGQECLGEIAILKKKVPVFAKDMFGTYECLLRLCHTNSSNKLSSLQNI